MKKVTTFPNPPITEAVIDIRVTLPKEVTIEQLAIFQEDIKKSFPIKKPRFAGEFQIKIGATPEISTTSNRNDGFLFYSQDGKKIVQARLDGFTFNKLKPYSNWENFSREAKYLWGHYLAIAKPINVVRLSLRYINKIEIPLPFKDFKEYILTIPDIAPGIPSNISGLFTQLTIQNPEIKAQANIIETIKKVTSDRGTLPFIFDIDVSRNAILESSSPEIWDILDQLRNFKNQIFLNSLTSKAKELFK